MIQFYRTITFSFCFIALCFSTTNAQAATVRTDPISSAVSLGDIFLVDVIGEGFPTTEGGGFNLTFDQSVVNAVSVSIDNVLWNFVNNDGTIDNNAGSLSDVLVSAFPGVSTGNFTIATIEFEAVSAGISELLLSESAMNPWASGASFINPGFTAEAVTVSAVPLPATVWFLCSGLLVLFGGFGKSARRTLA